MQPHLVCGTTWSIIYRILSTKLLFLDQEEKCKEVEYIIESYKNDVIATPTTRGRWYSYACNIGIGTAAAAAGALAAPTMGASVGMIVCTGLLQMLIC